MRRLIDLGASTPLAPGLYEQAEVRDGVLFRQTLPPGPERDRALEAMKAEQVARAARLDDLILEFRTLVARHDPVQLIKSITIAAGSGFAGPSPWVDDAPDTFTWPAKIEYLVGTALAMPPGTRDVPEEAIKRAVGLIVRIFEAATAKNFVDAVAAGSSGNMALDRALFTLRLEYLTDRMPGYVRHIESIDAEVFDRHRQHYIDDLGFNPGDVTRIVRRQVAHSNRQISSLFAKAQNVKGNTDAFALAVVDLMQALDRTREWDPPEIGAITGVDATHIAAILKYFSTTWGSQPDFRAPSDTNLARTRPCIDVGTDVFFVPDPWSLSAAVHPKLAKDAADGVGVLRRYWDHRAEAHQRLVAGALASLFGPVVYEEQHYLSESDGPGEVDAVVATNWPLIVEAKARGLTEPGRRGAPKRVQTVTKDVVEKALSQTSRARTYIINEGGRAFGDREGGTLIERLPSAIDGVTEVIITFERMDPVTTVGPTLVGERGRRVWITGLADLLMCTDILNDPGSFHHYVRVRAEAAAAGIHVSMESDALSGYLIDRLSSQLEQAKRHPDAEVELGYSSGAVNEYFTATEVGITHKPPTTGLPAQIATALAAAVGDPLWSTVVETVMTTDAATWTRFKRYARHHRTGLFQLADDCHLELGGRGIVVNGDNLTLGVDVRGAARNVRPSAR